MPKPKESTLDKAVARLLKKLVAAGVPIEGKKIHGNAFQSGLPDWHVTYHGRSVWIENKRPGLEPTPLQKLKLKRFARAGAITGVAYTIDEFRAILERVAPLPG